ncbi:MAG: RNA polymerase sigma factor FliA [Burkholderiaceae bacterium]
MASSEDILVGQYAPLVRRLALQLVSRLPPSVELDDLIQAGLMGLLDAVRRYQEMPEAQFETYASTRIRGAMLDELRSQDWLPRSARSKSRTIEHTIQKLTHEQLRPPTESEIAGALGVPLPDYHAMLDDARGVQIVHYEDLARNIDEGAAHPLDFGSDQAPLSTPWDNPLTVLESAGLRHALVAAIGALPEREQLVLSLQFEQDLNQKEIAAVMGITEGRVSQLRSQAVARLRASLAAGAWDESPGDDLLSGLL